MGLTATGDVFSEWLLPAKLSQLKLGDIYKASFVLLFV